MIVSGSATPEAVAQELRDAERAGTAVDERLLDLQFALERLGAAGVRAQRRRIGQRARRGTGARHAARAPRGAAIHLARARRAGRAPVGHRGTGSRVGTLTEIARLVTSMWTESQQVPLADLRFLRADTARLALVALIGLAVAMLVLR